ncbi:photosystem I chlorophyll a apoprotein A1 [Vigna unguiculata]|uniref:Photosystem I chlorophyll a apoprotein A1 n=1 Tax=Vigna unguiculata TaxID=3917 RepID=A0A4D6LEZ3_VIGUN|nr:photosystem I chlorophyll a apoprotein A1 [Vigna unguiculata]
MLGSLTIVVAHHMYSMPPYPYLATDYGTQLSLFTHHMWIGGFLIVGAAAHAAIFMVRDYDPTIRYNDLLDRVLRHRDSIISHLNWPIFAQWIQNTHALAPGTTAPGAATSTSLTWGGENLVAVGVLILLKGVLFARSSRLIPDKANLGLFVCVVWKEEDSMIIRSPEPEVKILVDRDPIKTSFEEWAKPGHFSRTIAKGPDTTTWIWNLHADAHDFDSHTNDLEEISRKVFSAHFGQLSIIFLWLSGMYFHGARFSNYEAWLSDPTHIRPSAQVVWPIVGQEILNGDVGGGFRGIQITSGFFQIWRASGITNELQLYCTAIGALVFAALMLFAGWFHYHKAAPKLAWFQDVESMLNHHLTGLLGLGSLSWAGHQIHVSLPINQFLNAAVDPKEIPLPHEFILNRDLLAQLYPSFSEGATPFFTLNWSKYGEFLTFRGGLDPVTGGLWLTDIIHHHLAIAILFLIAGHMYRTNCGIGHNIKDILEAHKGPFTGQGHKGIYEILTTSWHAQLSINLAARRRMGDLHFSGFR